MVKELRLTHFHGEHEIYLGGSKSESNRLLILKALYPDIAIHNLSNSDDTAVMLKALSSNANTIDVHHAGTAMRFLTAFYAFYTKKTIKLTGSERMQNRPIKVLVDALSDLGAKIEYDQNIGYPPLMIHPSVITKNEVHLQANISSQYISALMLSASKLSGGLIIKFTSEITSWPYIKMTVELMIKLGIKVEYDHYSIKIYSDSPITSNPIEVESDWSSASYFYSLVALSPELKLKLGLFRKKSLQGDSKLVDLYKDLGVSTTFDGNSIVLENTKTVKKTEYLRHLNDTPDLAQTIAVTCFGLNIPCKLTGLHTLKIKETDRLEALKTELEKLGARVIIDHDSLELIPARSIKQNQSIDTYNDHRMAMAFAPLCSKVNIKINDYEVVTKSYPEFWKDLENLSS